MKATLPALDARIDPELREVLGRARLMDELLDEGVRIALSVGGNDSDILASVARCKSADRVEFIPITVKFCHADSLCLLFGQSPASALLVALVEGYRKPSEVTTFAFTAAEFAVLKMVSVIDQAAVARPACTSKASRPPTAGLLSAMQSYTISPGQWRARLMSAFPVH